MIIFKSNPEFFYREKSGNKNNTVRKVNMSDERFKALRAYDNDCYDSDFVVRIQLDFDPLVYFDRCITDVAFWKGLCIITWNPSY